MTTIYDAPAAMPADVPAQGRSLRLAKCVAMLAGLAAVLAAAMFREKLGHFDTMFRLLGYDTADILTPLCRALLVGNGVIPVMLLGVTGVFAMASVFTGRRRMMFASGLVALLMAGGTATVIPVVVMDAVNKVVQDA